jgi:ABC-type proline/glycine betaine transport system permease subunit
MLSRVTLVVTGLVYYNQFIYIKEMLQNHEEILCLSRCHHITVQLRSKQVLQIVQVHVTTVYCSLLLAQLWGCRMGAFLLYTASFRALVTWARRIHVLKTEFIYEHTE